MKRFGYDEEVNIFWFLFLTVITSKLFIPLVSFADKLIKKTMKFEEDKKIHQASCLLLTDMKNETNQQKYGYSGDIFLEELRFIHKYKKQLES